MEAVDGHALRQRAVPSGQPVVDVDVPDASAISERCESTVDRVDRGHPRHAAAAIAARRDARDDDDSARRFLPHHIEDCASALHDLADKSLVDAVAPGGTHIVRPRQQHDDLRLNAVQLAVGQPPQDVLHGIAAPPEVGRVPAEEVAPPVVEELAILRLARAPAPRDRVALEVDVDPATPGFLDELFVRDLRVAVASCHRPHRRFDRRLCR